MTRNRPLLKACTIALAFTALFSTKQAAAQFTTGNVVVLQVGDGITAPAATATPVYLKEYNTITVGQASPVSAVTVPTSGPARLTVAGTSTTEGQVTLSTDSTKLVIAGYDTASTAVAPNTVTSALLARVADTISALGVVGRAASTNTVFSAQNIRSVVKGVGENYFAAGSNSGTYYLGLVAPPLSIQTTVTNTRVIAGFNGNIYFSTGSGTVGIYKIIGQPTVVTATTNLIPTGAGGSPNGFALNPAETIAYIADDRSGASGGGVYKWTLSGSTWSIADTLKLGGSVSARSVAVDWSGTYPTVYAITTDNRLIRWNDSAVLSDYYTVLATAPGNALFRSLTFTPKAPCVNPVLTTTITNRTCTNNGSVVLNVTSGTTPTTFAWTGPSFTASTQNIANLQAGTYNVTATTPGGCSATTSAIITNPTFTATATATGTTTVCQGDSVTINANTGTGFTYQWNNASGIIPGATNATFKAGATGAYTVTVSSGTNCTATSTPAIAVTVKQVGVNGITAGGPTTFCTGGSVQLCANITGPPSNYTYVWKLNGSAIPGQTALCYNAVASGNFCVTVTDVTIGCSATVCMPVTVGAAPTANVTPSGPVAICAGSSVTLHTNNATGLTYQWKNNNVNVATGGTDSTYIVNAAGSYTVVVSAGASCSSTSSAIVVTVNPLPVVTLTPGGPTTFCAGGNVQLCANVTPVGTYIYQWTLNGTPITGASGNCITATTAGNYCVNAVNAATGCLGSACTTVTVNPLPTAPITPAGPLTTCSNIPVVLHTNSATGLTYQWKKNGTNVATAGTDSTYAANSGGSYTVVVTNANSCSATSAAVVLSVDPAPVSTITPLTVSPSCSGQFIHLKTAKTVGATYGWSLNGVTFPGAVDSTLDFIGATSAQTPVTFNVKVVVTSSAGCKDSSVYAAVVNPAPDVTVSSFGGLSFCAGDSVIFSVPTGNNYIHSWSNNGTTIAGNANDSLTVTASGNYRAIITNNYGCMDSSAGQNVTVIPIPAPIAVYTAGQLSTGTFTSYQWYLNGIAIPGATSQNYIPLSNGSYTVVVTNAIICSAVSAAVVVNDLSVGSLAAAHIAIYPNPAQAIVYVKASMIVNAQIKDVHGRVLCTVNNATQVDISTLASGVYSISIYSNTGLLLGTQKLIKVN